MNGPIRLAYRFGTAEELEHFVAQRPRRFFRNQAAGGTDFQCARIAKLCRVPFNRRELAPVIQRATQDERRRTDRAELDARDTRSP